MSPSKGTLHKDVVERAQCPPVPHLLGCGGTPEGNGASLTALVVSSLLLDVFSLVTVQPAAAPVAKQLLPKTLGPSNVNIAAHVQHVPHMVSDPLLPSPPLSTHVY